MIRTAKCVVGGEQCMVLCLQKNQSLVQVWPWPMHSDFGRVAGTGITVMFGGQHYLSFTLNNHENFQTMLILYGQHRVKLHPLNPQNPPFGLIAHGGLSKIVRKTPQISILHWWKMCLLDLHISVVVETTLIVTIIGFWNNCTVQLIPLCCTTDTTVLYNRYHFAVQITVPFCCRWHFVICCLLLLFYI